VEFFGLRELGDSEMRAGLSTIQQTLTSEAANVLNHLIAEAANVPISADEIFYNGQIRPRSVPSTRHDDNAIWLWAIRCKTFTTMKPLVELRPEVNTPLCPSSPITV
jgi:hypothetical protein